VGLTVAEVVGSGELDTIRRIVEGGMGAWQAYYATTCVEQGYCRALVAFEYGRPAGVSLFYRLELQPRVSVGVVYYVVVGGEFRRRGIGRALVASAEHLLEEEGVDAVVATTRFDNVGSRKLFGSLGYLEIPLEVVESMFGEAVTKLTCSYEDDLLLFKGLTVDLEGLMEALSTPQNLRQVERLWYGLCYRPWLRSRRAPGGF
jgi:ribosomal protein S18 acetylase RimI-like enzyme